MSEYRSAALHHTVRSVIDVVSPVLTGMDPVRCLLSTRFLVSTLLLRVRTPKEFPNERAVGCSRLLARVIVLEEAGTEYEGMEERTGWVWNGC